MSSLSPRKGPPAAVIRAREEGNTKYLRAMAKKASDTKRLRSERAKEQKEYINEISQLFHDKEREQEEMRMITEDYFRNELICPVDDRDALH